MEISDPSGGSSCRNLALPDFCEQGFFPTFFLLASRSYWSLALAGEAQRRKRGNECRLIPLSLMGQ
jgi:hypothetical protein